jgi:micrococcal nuclease
VATRKFLISAFFFAALLTAGDARDSFPIFGNWENSHAIANSNGQLRRVARVIDGDTVVLSPNEKVRLIGVDTPETAHPTRGIECFGEAAKQFTRNFAEDKTVRLVFDETNRVRGHKDRYGRTLGYLYLADGRLLNAELIRHGYAHAYTRFPFRFIVEFRELERQARREGAGLWSGCRRID